MPFLALTKGSKQMGVQTYQRALRLAPELKDGEIAYLDMRDWYVNQVGLIAQMEEALSQAKAAGDSAAVKEIGGKLQYEQSRLRDVRDRVKEVGERSWSEAFYLAASVMLPKEARSAIEDQADKLLGRKRHELAKQQK